MTDADQTMEIPSGGSLPCHNTLALTGSSSLCADAMVQPANNYFAKLPVELVSLIFEFLVPAEFHSHCDLDCCPAPFDILMENQPLGLTAVCQTWRAVALSCRALWSRVSLELNHKSCITPQATRFLQQCLERSGRHPLSVGLYFDDEHAVDLGFSDTDLVQMLSMLRMLVTYKDRWSTLFIGTNNVDPQALMFPLRDTFPNLEHLILDLQGYCSEDFDIFSCCPSLHTVEVRLQGDGHAPKINLEASAQSIKHVAVTTLAECDFDTEHCLRHIISLIDQCWKLETLRFEPQVSWLTSRSRLDDDDCIDLAECRELVTYDSRLLEVIVDVSRLEKLTIVDRVSNGGDLCRRLHEVFALQKPKDLCTALTHLTLHTNLSVQLVSFLKRTPNVVHLTIRRDPVSPIFEPYTLEGDYEPWAACEDPCECECWGMDSLMQTVATSAGFLPLLRHFSVTVRRAKQWYFMHTEKCLEKLVRTRLGRLETFHFDVTMKTARNAPRTWWSRSALEAARRKGIDLRVSVGLLDEDDGDMYEDAAPLFVFPGQDIPFYDGHLNVLA